MASLAQRGHQLDKQRIVAVFENSFFRPNAKHDFVLGAKGHGLGPYTRSGKLQSAPTKCDLSGREDSHFAILKDRLSARDGFVESLESHALVRGMHQAGRDVAAIGTVHFDYRIVPLVKLEQAPLGRRPIHVRHALADQ